MSGHIIVPHLEEIRIKIDGEYVVLVSSKGSYIKIPYQVIPTLARSMRSQGKVVEERVNALRLISDQAFALRAGIPIGFTNDPAKQHQAGIDAAWDPNLRKQLPGNIKGTTMFGTPTIIKHAPKPAKKTEEEGNGKSG